MTVTFEAEAERPDLLELVALTRPRIERLFGDESALVIIGAVRSTIKTLGREVGYHGGEIKAATDAVFAEMTSGSYDELLAVARRYIRFRNDEGDDE